MILTPKQFDIIKLIQENPGWTQQQIADKLEISQASVSYHLKQMIKKNSGCSNLQEIIRTFDARTSYRIYEFKPKLY